MYHFAFEVPVNKLVSTLFRSFYGEWLPFELLLKLCSPSKSRNFVKNTSKCNSMYTIKECRISHDADFHETHKLSRVLWQIFYRVFHPRSTKNEGFLVPTPVRP